MKITQRQLRQIIQEEISHLSETPVRTGTWAFYKRELSNVSKRSGELAEKLGDAMGEEEFRKFLGSNQDLRALLRDIRGELNLYRSSFDRLPDSLD